MKRVAVIGSGAAGLTATKHLTAPGSGFTCVTYEQTDNIGGTWVYTDTVGRDKYGLPVHSSMYQSLKTNLPKEIMELPGFPHGGPAEQSYIPANLVLNYLNDYAEHFGLKKYVKFHHHVKSVDVLDNEKWVVKVVDLATKVERTEYFDGVIVCVGNYSNPLIPNHLGVDQFEGKILHSHDYRKADIFKDKRAVTVGCGPSGLDITFDISKVAKQVYISHHSEKVKHIRFPDNVTQKPDIKCVKKNSVEFSDGTEVEVDMILYCTGYTYKYSFLSENVGIKVENRYVQPLYKHMINIEHPSMCIIGIPRDTTGFYMFDLQVRFFLKTMKNPSLLPSKEDMLADTKADEKMRTERGQKQKDFHIMGRLSNDYFDSIVKVGQLDPVPPVLLDVYFAGFERLMEDFSHFREDKYKIVDKEHFIREVKTYSSPFCGYEQETEVA